MGSIFRRGNRWYYCFKATDGRWVKRVGGDSKEEALAALAGLEGSPVPEAQSPVSPLITAYLRKLTVYAKVSSQKGAASSCGRLLRHFAAHPFDQLGLDAFVASRAQAVSRKSVNNDLIILRAAVNYALELGLLGKSPFRVRLLKTNRKRQLTLLSADDIKRLLSASRATTHGIILISAATGMRLGEILHLQWRDVLPDSGAVRVSPKRDWSPKNHQARTLYVTADVLDYLKTRREEAKYRADSDWVFGSRKGGTMWESNVCHQIQKIFKRAGLYRAGESTTHRIRHAVASRMLSNGVSIEVARLWLGHASTMTTALYCHATEEEKKRAAHMIGLLGR